MCFVLGLDPETQFKGTVLERRIDDTLAQGSKANYVYKPRSAGDNSVKQDEAANMKNMKYYTQEQVDL